MISFLLTLALCWVTLTKAEKKTAGRGVLNVEPLEPRSMQVSNTAPFVVVGALCVALLPISFYLRNMEPTIPQRASFSSFPLKINNLIAEEDQLPLIEQEILQMSDYFLGHYREEGLPPISPLYRLL